MIRVPLRLFARGKSAVVVAVGLCDAPPKMLESLTVAIIAGDSIELCDALD